MDNAQWVALTNMITALTTLGLAKGVPALIRYIQAKTDRQLQLKKADMEHERQEEDRIDANYQIVIAELRSELRLVRETQSKLHEEHTSAMRKLQDEHVECMRKQGEFQGRLEEIEKAMLRHDRANREHVQVLQQEVNKLQRIAGSQESGGPPHA